jgi:hypothetical protein
MTIVQLLKLREEGSSYGRVLSLTVNRIVVYHRSDARET